MGANATVAAAGSSMTWISSTKGMVGLTTLIVKTNSSLFPANSTFLGGPVRGHVTADPLPSSRRTRDGQRKGPMGDKGGKRDKEKSKQQQAKKHQDDAQRKQDNAPRPKQDKAQQSGKG